MTIFVADLRDSFTKWRWPLRSACIPTSPPSGQSLNKRSLASEWVCTFHKIYRRGVDTELQISAQNQSFLDLCAFFLSLVLPVLRFDMSNKFSSGTIRLLSRHVQEHERAKHGAYSRCVKERLSVLCSLTSISVIRLLLVETHNRVFVDQRIHRVLCSYVNGGSDISQIRSPVQLSSKEPAHNVCFSRTPPCCCTCLPSKAFLLFYS